MTTLGSWPGQEFHMETGDRFIRVLPVPFGRGSFAGASRDRLYVGVSDAWAIEVRYRTGALTGLIRRAKPLDPVEDAHRDAFREEYLARSDDEEDLRRMEGDLSKVEWRKTFPAFGSLETDTEGNLWVASPERPGEAWRSWAVFDPAGRLLGDVVMPEALTVHDIGSDFVAGVYRDDLEVEFVLVYGVEKAAGPPARIDAPALRGGSEPAGSR